jgi:S-adenosylmethionine:tRNA ribosyltransferase-isomerase
MLVADFDYELPAERIAQRPTKPRDACRLLVAHRAARRIEHRRFRDILAYLTAGDVLVVNETKVMPARLQGHKIGGKAAAEVLLLRQLSDDGARWQVLVSPGRRLKPGTEIAFEGLVARVEGWAADGTRGGRVVALRTGSGEDIMAALHRLGQLPLPPYIHDYTGDSELYQTVYARNERSAAAPTAGLHFTPELLERIKAKGVNVVTVDLEIGLDTFRPVTEDRTEDHAIHSEYYTLPSTTVQALRDARAAAGRVIAVGTTAVRSLESAWDATCGEVRAVTREQTRLYITPGFHFQLTDALLTNFHLPRSTLMMLVAAFADLDFMRAAYKEALTEGYRFLSFGDAMLIV